jgi:hypothetical protein
VSGAARDARCSDGACSRAPLGPTARLTHGPGNDRIAQASRDKRKAAKQGNGRVAENFDSAHGTAEPEGADRDGEVSVPQVAPDISPGRVEGKQTLTAKEEAAWKALPKKTRARQRIMLLARFSPPTFALFPGRCQPPSDHCLRV